MITHESDGSAAPGQSLTESGDNKLRNALSQAPFILFALDRNGIFTLSEGDGLHSLGLKPGEVVGRSALDMYQKNPPLIEEIRRALRVENFTSTSRVENSVFETRYSSLLDADGRFNGVVGFSLDVTEWDKREEVFKHRVEFGKLISALTSHFINLPIDKIDAGIQQALQTIGRFIKAERIYIFMESHGAVVTPAFIWSAEDAPPPINWPKNMKLSDYPWFFDKLNRLETVLLGSPEDLPPIAVKEKEFLISWGIKSIISVPMVSAGRIIGFMTFSTLREARDWDTDDIAFFRIAGDLFAGTLERKRSELALRESEEKFRELFNKANDAIFLFPISDDAVPGKFMEVNDIACSKISYLREELLHMTPYDLAVPEDVNGMPKHFRALLEKGQLIGAERSYLSKNGLKIPFEINFYVFNWNGRKVVQAVARDITDRKRADETIRHQAYYDVLTNLPNRTLFKDRLEQAMKTAKLNNQLLSVLVLDLDRFKNINETLGHQVGDKLLVAVAERLLDVLNQNETIARFGGDEFTLLLPQVSKIEDATEHAQKIIELLSTPFKLNGHELHVTTSIGIAFYPEDGENPEVLMKNSETAMYRAKEQGRNNYQLYASVMNVSAFKQLLMENNLRRALEKEEFVVYYQPQIDMKTQKVIGAEALVRWQHPDLGLVFPTEFIGLAEETGLIVPIGEWVIRHVCQQIKKWHEAGNDKFCIFVNLSGRQFQQKNLVSSISQILQETGMDPQYLGLEITETIAMKNADFTILALNEFKKMGIHLSLDDFGTGYSSLSYLKRFPLETLKIDKSFVRDITIDPNDAAIVTGVIALAHSLKLEVVAEGVETEGQLTFLKNHDCDHVQGYFYSHPLPGESFLRAIQGLANLKPI